MLPLSDHRQPKRFPVITWLLVLANIGVFAVELGWGGFQTKEIIDRLALVPRHTRELGLLLPHVHSLITHMFLHGSLFHLLGNMWFLLLLGDDVEERLGRLPFLGFYMACGGVAALSHILSNPSSAVPMLGASGAVAGVLGGFLVLYPNQRITTLVFILPVPLPAWVPLLTWAVLQIVPAFTSVGQISPGAGGVAWWAHVGGFAVGACWLAVVTAGSPRRGRA